LEDIGETSPGFGTTDGSTITIANPGDYLVSYFAQDPDPVFDGSTTTMGLTVNGVAVPGSSYDLNNMFHENLDGQVVVHLDAGDQVALAAATQVQITTDSGAVSAWLSFAQLSSP
jgi:hypothetical protein